MESNLTGILACLSTRQGLGKARTPESVPVPTLAALSGKAAATSKRMTKILRFIKLLVVVYRAARASQVRIVFVQELHELLIFGLHVVVVITSTVLNDRVLANILILDEVAFLLFFGAEANE